MLFARGLRLLLYENVSACECLLACVKAATSKLFHNLPLQGIKLFSMPLTLGGCCTEEKKREEKKKKWCVSSCLVRDKAPCSVFPDLSFSSFPMAGCCVSAFSLLYMAACPLCHKCHQASSNCAKGTRALLSQGGRQCCRVVSTGGGQRKWLLWQGYVLTLQFQHSAYQGKVLTSA